MLLHAADDSFSFVAILIDNDHDAVCWSVILQAKYAKIVCNNTGQMAIIFLFDLDCVIFKHPLIEFNEGALNCSKKIKAAGHRIVFTSDRKSSNNNIPSLQLDLTFQKFQDAGV